MFVYWVVARIGFALLQLNA